MTYQTNPTYQSQNVNYSSHQQQQRTSSQYYQSQRTSSSSSSSFNQNSSSTNNFPSHNQRSNPQVFSEPVDKPIYERNDTPVKIAEGPDMGEISTKLKNMEFGWFITHLLPKLVKGCGVTGSLFIFYVIILIVLCVIFHVCIMSQLYDEDPLKGFDTAQAGARGFIAIGQVDCIGVISIGQVAMGMFVFGQVAIGCCTIGMVPIGLCWCFIPLVPFLLFFCVAGVFGFGTCVAGLVSVFCGVVGFILLPNTFRIGKKKKDDDDDEEEETTIEGLISEQRQQENVSINNDNDEERIVGRPVGRSIGTGPGLPQNQASQGLTRESTGVQYRAHQQQYHQGNLNQQQDSSTGFYQQREYSQQQQQQRQRSSQSIDAFAMKPPTVPDLPPSEYSGGGY